MVLLLPDQIFFLTRSLPNCVHFFIQLTDDDNICTDLFSRARLFFVMLISRSTRVNKVTFLQQWSAMRDLIVFPKFVKPYISEPSIPCQNYTEWNIRNSCWCSRQMEISSGELSQYWDYFWIQCWVYINRRSEYLSSSSWLKVDRIW